MKRVEILESGKERSGRKWDEKEILWEWKPDNQIEGIVKKKREKEE